MPKGVNKKPDHLKQGEVARGGVVTTDDVSDVDKGWDFVKSGERSQIANRQ